MLKTQAEHRHALLPVHLQLLLVVHTSNAALVLHVRTPLLTVSSCAKLSLHLSENGVRSRWIGWRTIVLATDRNA